MPLVVPKSVSPFERPSRWRLTYAFELQVFTAQGTAVAGRNRVVNLPINPREYEVTEKYAQQVTPTIGGIVTEEGGFSTKDVVVSGTCGLQHKRGWSPGNRYEPGGLFFADGNTIWRELRALFRLYAALKRNASEALEYRMVWHDFRAGDHWVITPVSFNFNRRRGEDTLTYPYRIAFTATAELESDDTGRGVFGEINRGFDEVIGTLDEITGYVDDAGAFVDEANILVANTLGNAIAAAGRLGTAAAGLRQGVQDSLALPWRLGVQAQLAVDQWAAAVEDLMIPEADAAGAGQGGGVVLPGRAVWDPSSERGDALLAQLEAAQGMGEAVDALLARRDLFSRSWRDLALERRGQAAGEAVLSSAEIAAAQAAPAAHRGLSSRATAGSAARRGVAERRARQAAASPSYTGQRAYSVRAGDTMLGIAQREIGDLDAWADIADVNALQPPYITPLRLPGTVWVGDVLMLPTVGTGDQDVIPSTGPTLDEDPLETLLGTDFLMDDDGEWVVDVGSGSTDVVLVSGLDNFVQGLERIQFRTPLGSNPVFPNVGILLPIGEANGQGVPEAIAVSVRNAAARDPRTAGVGPVLVTDTGDGAVVEITLYPRGTKGGRVFRRAVE